MPSIRPPPHGDPCPRKSTSSTSEPTSPAGARQPGKAMLKLLPRFPRAKLELMAELLDVLAG